MSLDLCRHPSFTRTLYAGDFAHGAGLAPVGGDVHLEHDLLQKEPDGLVMSRRSMQRTKKYRINRIHFERTGEFTYLGHGDWRLVSNDPEEESGGGLSSSLVELHNWDW
jgi:hypothetical protein